NTAPSTDGCECTTASTAIQGTAGCCNGSTPSTTGTCQPQHDTGFTGEHWYDCVAVGTYNGTQAGRACTAHGSTDCTHTGICGNATLLCDNTVGMTGITCNCWQYIGSNGGGVGKVSHGTNGCLCTASSDGTW